MLGADYRFDHERLGAASFLAERRLVETAQFAAVKAVALVAQQVERLDPDSEVLADRPLVEGIGLTRQLQFAVQRLIGHAQQRPIRNAEAITLSGNSG